MKNIPLTGLHGEEKFTLVDDEDFKKVSKYTWNIRGDKAGQQYVRHSIGRKSIYLHRFLLNAPEGVDVDHIDGNRLNNQKSNLRLCNRQQNSFNSSRKHKPESGYRGVYKVPDGNEHPWAARYGYKYKTYNIGYFATAIDAAKAYDKKVKELFGEFAKLNFPELIADVKLRILQGRPLIDGLELKKGEVYEVSDIVENCYVIKVPRRRTGFSWNALVEATDGELI